MSLRKYQKDLRTKIEESWERGMRFVLAVLPTGGGKTRTFSDIILAHTMGHIISVHKGASCAIAHRQELVSQISLALNRDKVKHRIIAPPKVIKACVKLHMEDCGYSSYDVSARCAVAGVDTLVRRSKELGAWLASVTLWVQDEAHHVLRENKWGKAAEMFPNAKGLGVTASPIRADGKGLGSEFDGIFEEIVVGPNMRELINMGYLVDYRIFAPPSDLDLTGIEVSQKTGDYNPNQVAAAVKKSHIIGDVVEHYLRIANGKRGITFVPNLDIAKEVADKFNEAGVPAKMVSSDTPDIDRFHAVRDLASGKILQLVNVDLFGEGVDVPAVEVVSFARPTESYSLFIQQSGRALRLLIEASISKFWESMTPDQRKKAIAESAKPKAIIIDHVGNVLRHGLPDAPKQWSLSRREKRGSKKKDQDVIPVRFCEMCTAVYERIYKSCPYCGHTHVVTARGAPEQVDGDLYELDATVLARMRGEVALVDMSLEDKRLETIKKRMPIAGQMYQVNLHEKRQLAQRELREAMSVWGGVHTSLGREDSEIQRRFFFRYGVDVLSAQALGTKEANLLKNQILIDISDNM